MFFALTHSFTNIFAGGRSDTKTVTFFLYLSLLFFIFSLVKNKTIRNLPLKYPFVTIGLLYTYGLLLHVIYALKIGFSPWVFTITSRNRELSTSILTHTHLAKGSIGIVLPWFNEQILNKADAGGAYIGFFPSWVFYIGTLLLGLSIIQALVYFATTSKKISGNFRQKIFYILLYGVMSFTLIKTAVDGGIINLNLLILVLVSLAFFNEKIDKKKYFYISIIVVILMAFISMKASDNSMEIGLGLASGSAFLALLLILQYGTGRSIRYQLFIPVIILFISCWWLASDRDRSIYEYSRIPITKGELYYHYDKVASDIVTEHSLKDTFVYKEADDTNLTYAPISIPGKTCMAKSRYIEASGILITPEAPNIDISGNKKDFIQVKQIFSSKEDDLWYTSIVGEFAQCTPEPLSVLDGILKQKNSWYVLTKFKFNDQL